MLNPKTVKIDEWCYYEFELSQVKEISEEMGIHDLTNGIIRSGGRNMERWCFPLDMRVKLISETYAYYRKRIHELKCNDLNHPDIHRHLVSEWTECCEHKEDNDYIQKMYDRLSKFYHGIEDSIHEKQKATLDGVRIFGR